MKPYEILRSATQLAGEFTKWPSGTIEPGQRADLILLNGSPLQDVQN